MPKFVSGSSGHIYGPEQAAKKEEEEEALSGLQTHDQQSATRQKPSAINKRGTKEKQKNSLDLFKEELRRLTEERDAERERLRKAIKDSPPTPTSLSSGDTHQHQATIINQQNQLQNFTQPIVVPLKPDPRCPTSLTLQVNLNPRGKEPTMGGSFDNGNPMTTNIYLGNLNPTVNEYDLCDIFGKFGPLASIKVMWPRTDEERARNRNSGFVAYMNRMDAEKAMKALNGRNIRGYDLKLGWGKAVPLPQTPVYVPVGWSPGCVKHEMLNLLQNLNPVKAQIGSAMVYCIDHSDAAQEVIDCIYESLCSLDSPFQRKIAQLFLVSDVLHNCSAAVTNASFYRKGFQQKLVSIYEHLRQYLVNIEDRHRAESFKQKALSVLGAWREWTLYEDEFVIQLSNILLGIQDGRGVQNLPGSAQATDVPDGPTEPTVVKSSVAEMSTMAAKIGEGLDGEMLDEATLSQCLEAKGLSMRWYKTLELSDDEGEGDLSGCEGRGRGATGSPMSARGHSSAKDMVGADRIKFKTSKWETVDPNEVAEQAVSLTKWQRVVSGEHSPCDDSSGVTDSSSESGSPRQKRPRRASRSPPSN